MAKANEAFIPVQRVMYSPDGSPCQCEESQIEELKAAGFTVTNPNADILDEQNVGEKGALADGKAAHSKAVQANIEAQQAAAAESD